MEDVTSLATLGQEALVGQGRQGSLDQSMMDAPNSRLTCYYYGGEIMVSLGSLAQKMTTLIPPCGAQEVPCSWHACSWVSFPSFSLGFCAFEDMMPSLKVQVLEIWSIHRRAWVLQCVQRRESIGTVSSVKCPFQEPSGILFSHPMKNKAQCANNQMSLKLCHVLKMSFLGAPGWEHEGAQSMWLSVLGSWV